MEKMLRTLLRVLCLALPLVLAGCASLIPSDGRPAPRTYLLDASPAAADATPRRGDAPVLLVDQPRAQPGFDTPYIAYSRDPLSLDYYTKSQWADTPARMLTPLVVNALEDSGAFRAVLAPPAAARADLRLELELLRLVQEFRSGPSQVRLALRARLFRISDRQVLATRLFETAEPAPSDDAEGAARAANAALARLLAELRGFVVNAAS
ncbi:MAG TPA: ABC-type transport auxiliary lipoprotein family protein [Candidatus Competibacteraceae bacterium]|nr:ABC-type transport auxiliary lipoprotein family protein [Candidatus Competibacteraceae bacterium]